MKKFILLLFTVAGFGQTVVPSGTSMQITDFKGGLKATKMFEFPSSAVSAWPGIRRAQYNESTNRLEIHNGTAYEAYAKMGDLSGYVPYTSPTSSVDLGTTYGLTGAFLGGGYGGSTTAPAPVSAKNAAIPSAGNTSTVFGTFNSVGQRQVFVFVDDADVHYIGNRGAGNQASNTVFGAFAFGKNTTGSSSSFFGYEAGFSNTTGSGNTGVGYQALRGSTTGNVNTAFGQYAGLDLTVGSFNTFLGRRAGYGFTDGSRNLFITTGQDEGSGITNGNGNVLIGRPIGLPATTSNMVWIGDGNGNPAFVKSGSAVDITGTLTVNGTAVMLASTDYVRNLKTEASVSSITGTNTETILKTIPIPANTLEEGYLKIDAILSKTGTANTIVWRLYKNTTNSIVGATQIATYNGTATNLTAFFHREYTVRGTGIYGYNFSGTLLSDDTATSSIPVQGATLIRTVDNYLIMTGQLTDGGDTGAIYGLNAEFSKNN